MAEFRRLDRTSKRTQDELREILSGGYAARRQQMDNFVGFLLRAAGPAAYNYGRPFSLDIVSDKRNTKKLGRVSIIDRVTAYDVSGAGLVRAQLGPAPTEEIHVQRLRQPTLLRGRPFAGPFEVLLGAPVVLAAGSMSELDEPFTDVDVEIAVDALVAFTNGLESLTDAAQNPHLNPKMAASLGVEPRWYSGLQTRS